MKVPIIGGTGLISTGIVQARRERNAAIAVFNRGRTDDRLGPEVTRLTGDRRYFAPFERAVMAQGPWEVCRRRPARVNPT